MNKKGFTLIEILGVVIIITAIALLVVPNVVNRFSNKKNDIDKVNEELIISAAKLYVSEHVLEYPKEDSASYCININDLVDSGYLNEKVININNHNMINEYSVKVLINQETNNNFLYNLVKREDCE